MSDREDFLRVQASGVQGMTDWTFPPISKEKANRLKARRSHREAYLVLLVFVGTMLAVGGVYAYKSNHSSNSVAPLVSAAIDRHPSNTTYSSSVLQPAAPTTSTTIYPDSIISTTSSSGGTTTTTSAYYVSTFFESGLPAGYSWSVTYGGMNGLGTAGNAITFVVTAGTYSFSVVNVPSGYTASPMSGSLGAGSSDTINYYQVQTTTTSTTGIGTVSTTSVSTTATTSTTTSVTSTSTSTTAPTLIPVWVSVACSPSHVSSLQNTTCTVTVMDAGTGSPVTSDGTVSFQATVGGSFSPAVCTLSSGSCSVTYEAPSVTTATIITITATYSGDSVYAGGSGHTHIHVS